MNKGLAKILIGLLPVFLIAVMLDGGSLSDLADALYALIGLTWLIVGSTLAIRVVTDKK